MLEEPPMYFRNSFVYREGKADRKRIWICASERFDTVVLLPHCGYIAMSSDLRFL